MSEYKLSVAAHKTKMKYGMKEAAYLIYADLRAAGWAKGDAWAVAFQGIGLNWPKNQYLAEIEKLENLESVQTRIAELQGRKHDNGELTPEELAKATSKEQILTDLVIARKSMKPGTKEWFEATTRIADYNKIKQDEIQTEDSVVHFFLPVNYPTSHEDCLLFKNGKCKGGMLKSAKRSSASKE